MRKRVSIVAGLAAGAGLVTAVGVTTAIGSHHSSTTAEPTKLISYNGYQTRVPASWPVYDLSSDPTRCVRFDQHAVYLGKPGTDQNCPAHAVGRTEALLIEPLNTTGPTTPAATETSSGDGSGNDPEEGVLHTDLPDARVSVTATYDEDRTLASSFLTAASADSAEEASTATDPSGSLAPTASDTATATPTDTTTPTPTDSTTTTTPADSQAATNTPSDSTTTPTASDTATATPTDTTTPTPTDTATPTPSPTSSVTTTSAPPATPSPSASATPTPSPTPTKTWQQGFPVSPKLIAKGYGFDTCAAPSVHSMYVWRPSVMDTVGIYVGGINRACPDGNLSATWVKTVRSYGYSFIPIYVGRQPPCTNRSWAKIDPRSGYAYAQGAAAGDDAVAKMRKFGFGRGNPVYLDIEYYTGDATCTKAILAFTTGWVRHLHAAGYVAGFYSTAASGVGDIAAAYGPTNYKDLPDTIWFARWNNLANLDATPYVPDNLWPGRRIKQYTGGHQVRINGVTINIDSDYLYGPVGLPGSF